MSLHGINIVKLLDDDPELSEIYAIIKYYITDIILESDCDNIIYPFSLNSRTNSRFTSTEQQNGYTPSFQFTSNNETRLEGRFRGTGILF